ncbi:MAG TPA: phosphoglycerate dehydrogenase [Candidatus Nanopelagicales bacterium]|nr:phosphoglycerate dehydrogenase [Candidatus Nanopelagicales bacterium]
MSKPVVLIAEELSPATVEALGPDFEIRHCDGANRDELLAAIVDVDAILVRSATKVDAEALAAATKLQVVARAGVGLDNVDVKAATQAGVMVVNAPTSNIVSAAELAVALLLACARNIAPASQSLKAGQWKRSKYTGVELTDKTVGVVGLGRIGLLVAQRLSAFGVKLVAYDPYVQPARAAQLGIRMATLDELLAESDFITVHLPKTLDTVGLIGEEALRKVKPSVRIVNAARGGIVDEHALYVALKEGRVAGAGIDVFASEPCTDSPLFEFESVVVTPHLGASTDEAQEKAGIAVARSVRLALAGELVPDAVNVKGGPIAEAVRPGIALAENIGRVAGSLSTAPLEAIEVVVLGEVAEHDVKILELSALKGVFSALVTDPVSYVNAPVLAAERGVAVSLTTTTEPVTWRNTVRVHLSLTDGTQLTVGGTVTGPRAVQRLVEIDGFEIDVPVSAHVAFLRYTDRPGVVGAAGRLLGDAGINIAGMQVSRDEAGGQALIALTVDSAIPADVLAAMAQEIGATSARSVDLDL